MKFRVLGPLEVIDADAPVPVSAGKHRVALAGLLLRANATVPVDQLAAWLWPDGAPPKTRAAVQVHIARLRKALGGDAVLQTAPGGYRIEIAPERLDLLRFTDLAAEGRCAAAAGDLDRADALLTGALALWRGPALADVESPALHRDEVPAVEARRLAVYEEWLGVRIRRGRAAEVAEEATRVIRDLHRSGRPAEALAAYRRTAEALAAAGLEPGAELRALRAELAPGPRTTGGWVVARQLPVAAADFVGRDADLAATAQRLRGVRDTVAVVNVSGSPGAGKSALAVQVAHRVQDDFPDGQWYVRLDGASAAPREPAGLLAQLLVQSGVDGDLPDDLDALSAALRSRLIGRRVLIVLDDAHDGAQVAPFLPGAPGNAVLVTGRTMLTGVDGVHEVRLGPLTAGESAALLGELLGPQRLAAEPEAAGDIAALCGHLPLALRVAGARLARRPSAGLAPFVGRLRDQRGRLDELTVGPLAVRAAFDLSFSALDAPAQYAFLRLGLLPTTEFRAWMLGALLDGDGERAVEQLVEASLVDPAGTDATGEPLYRVHDLLAVYAQELVAPADDSDKDAARRRLWAALHALAAVAWRSGVSSSTDLPPDDLPPPDRADPDQVRLLAADPPRWQRAYRALAEALIEQACRHGRHADAARLMDVFATALGGPGHARRLLELHRLVEQAALAAGDERVAWRARYAIAHTVIYHDAARTRELLAACAEAFGRLGAPREQIYSLHGVALCWDLAGAPDLALKCAEEALALAAQDSDPASEGVALQGVAFALMSGGRPADALVAFERAAAINERLGQKLGASANLQGAARAAMAVGEVERAGELSRRGLAICVELGYQHGVGWLTMMVGLVALAAGRPAEAVGHAASAVRTLAEVGDPRGEGTAAVALARALVADGRAVEAVPVLERALVQLGEVGAMRDHDEARELLDTLRPSAILDI